MVSRETKVDINFLHRQGHSFREIARKTGRDRRTVKRYSENPELIGQGRAKVERPSILDRFVPVVEGWLKEDGDYQASWIFDQLKKFGYAGGYTIVKDLVRKIKQERSRIAYIRFETEPGRQAQSARLYRKVHKDCTISVDGSVYEVPHTLVGKRIVVQVKDGVLRVFDDDQLMVTHTQSPVKGRLVRLPGLREAILADRNMNERKYGYASKGKARVTTSPALGRYPVEVERRPLSVYARIGGGVGYV